MLEQYIKELINNKSVLILGFGREGKSTLSMLQKIGGFLKIAIADLNPVSVDNITVYSGADYQNSVADYDVVFKSPGVVLENMSFKDKIISQTDVIINCFKNSMIGITGTKGKSTTTSLIYHVLKTCNKKPLLMGNIGIPAFDVIGEVSDDTIIVYELSCHQLEFAKKSPHRGVLLNIYPEHLDHYGTFEKYTKAKQNLYLNMEKDDFLVCGHEFLPANKQMNVTSVSMDNKNADYYADESSIIGKHIVLNPECNLFGAHNMYNIAAAFAVCNNCGINEDEFLNALTTFKPLAHRLELFAEIDSVRYFDDSISTIPETAIKALSSVKNIGTVILGGMDRGVDLSLLAEYLIKNPVPNVILIPDTGIKLFKLLEEKFTGNIILASDLKEAAEISKKVTESGFACILSPAAASYGFFKNFEERGDCFKSFIINC